MKHIKIYLTILFSALCFTVSFGIPMAGNYTIDKNSPVTATNFQSFNSCATSLTVNGISADVFIAVAVGSGPYTEQVIFTNIAGMSATAGIELNGNGETIIGLTNATNRHTVRLTNMQYFNIVNLKVERDIASTSGFNRNLTKASL